MNGATIPGLNPRACGNFRIVLQGLKSARLKPGMLLFRICCFILVDMIFQAGGDIAFLAFV